MSERTVIFITRNETQILHHAFSIALAALALDRQVDIFFFADGLSRLVRGPLDVHSDDPDVADRMEDRQMPKVSELLARIRDCSACKLFACSGSMAALGLKVEAVEKSVDAIVGLTWIISNTSTVIDRHAL